MNEFLCHKFLTDNHYSYNRNDDHVEDDDELENKNHETVNENQRLLITDTGSRQYKTWLRKIGRLSTRETKYSPQRYEHRSPLYQNNNPTYKVPARTTSKSGTYSSFGNDGQFIVAGNRVQQYKKTYVPTKPEKYFTITSRARFTKNKLKDYWKRKKFRNPTFQKYPPVFYNARESDFPYGLQQKAPTDRDKNTPWFVTTELPRSMNNATVKLDYNFWDMENTTPYVLSYGESPNLTPSPPIYEGDPLDYQMMDDGHEHWHVLPMVPDMECDCDDKDDGSKESDGDGPLAELMKNDMYHTALIVFAFIGFTTFFMNMMSGLNNGNNQVPSIIFAENNDNSSEDYQRKFEKREMYLNNLMERATLYIEQFQEVLSSMSSNKDST